MLAARCAWTILHAEHDQIRQYLDAIAEAQRAVPWAQPGTALARLREAVETLQSFDLASHRPKGIALMEALRGRSPDADLLLTVLEQERESDDALLGQALDMLDTAAAGDAHAAVDCAALLAQHREHVLHHLEKEDTLLCAHTEQLLTEEEWSLVVSAISSALYAAGLEPVGEGRDAGPPR